MILPRTKVPEIQLSLINDTNWKLSEQTPENFTLMIFYRGLHCPVCKKQLEEVAGKLEKITDRGTNVIAISMDTEERAKKTGEKWDIPSLPVGYNLSPEQAESYGLYFSEGVNDKEPAYFSEPGMFLVRPDRTLYFSSVQTMPFARPQIDDILNAIDYVVENDYPARGESKKITINA